jgi:uncharacterized damage-inducible protein DinB
MGERETYAHYLRWILADIVGVMEELDDEQRRWRPLETANDALTVARHVIGATRSYAIEIGCGIPIGRDRDAEFRPAEDDGTLVERLRALDEEVADAFARVDDASFNLPAEAKTEWTASDPPTGTRRDVVVQSIRHAGIHLGELRLTADLAKRTRTERR